MNKDKYYTFLSYLYDTFTKEGLLNYEVPPKDIKDKAERVEDYLNGNISELTELEEVLLDFWGNGLDYKKETPCHNDWAGMVTVNPIS